MPKGEPSNNQRKREWYCFTSEYDLLRLIRGKGILNWFDIYQPEKRLIEACEKDILEFINRECRTLTFKLTKEQINELKNKWEKELEKHTIIGRFGFEEGFCFDWWINAINNLKN